MDDIEQIQKSLESIFQTILTIEYSENILYKFIESEMEEEVLRISRDDEELLLKIRQYQWDIKKKAIKVKDPIERILMTSDLFWSNIHKFY
jgi:hypothetical protein